MKVAKRTSQYSIYQKRSGRYAVRTVQEGRRVFLRGDERLNVLMDEGLMARREPKPQVEASEAAEAAAS